MQATHMYILQWNNYLKANELESSNKKNSRGSCLELSIFVQIAKFYLVTQSLNTVDWSINGHFFLPHIGKTH